MESEVGTNDGCALGQCSTAVSPTPLQLCQIGVRACSPEQLGGREEVCGGGGQLKTVDSRVLNLSLFAITFARAT